MTELILIMNGHMTKSYRKLMYGQINDTKHSKTFITRPFGNSLDLRSVGDLNFFAHKAHDSEGKQIVFFPQRLKKTFVASILTGWSRNRKQD